MSTTSDIKQRRPTTESTASYQQNGNAKAPRRPSLADDDHPAGPVKHGWPMQLARIVAFGVYFFGSGLFIHFAQLLGAPLYLLPDRKWFDAYMALTKEYFGLLVTTMTQWWSPTIVRISGDKSVAGLLHQNSAGMLEVDFGDRIVLMSNHQIYTDWLYLWWTAYTNTIPTHGHIYIILKESLKYVPLIGPAMQFYGFIFMARKWSKDQERLRYRLRKLNEPHTIPKIGKKDKKLDSMWLMIFPEGTNLSANTRMSSARYASKEHIEDMRHLLLPRSTGLQFCLQELRPTVDYLYDCTIAYEGVPHGGYGQDIFTLRSVYFQGRPPKSVNMHWRRFAIKDMPIDDADAMHEWVLQRWREKDDLIDAFLDNGKFPGSTEAVDIEGGPKEKEWKTPYINTQVMPRKSYEFLTMFGPVVFAALVGVNLVWMIDRLLGKG